MTALQSRLVDLGACSEAVKWIRQHDDIISAWRACQRGDWLLWLAATLCIERRLVTLVACDCARLVLPLTMDPRAHRALHAAEQWAIGNPEMTDERVKGIAAEANFAVYSPDASALESAFAAAAAAALSVDNPRIAALAAGAASRSEGSAICAYIVRKRIDEPTILAKWNDHNVQTA